MPKTISFIGTGKMAAALISSIHKKDFVKSIIASGRNEENLDKIKNKFNIKTTKDNKEAARNSDVIFLCVKPQDFDLLLNEIKSEVKSQLIVSIAAGIRTIHIEKILGKRRVIRVMPNVNCLVGEMAAGFAGGKYAKKEDMDLVEKILSVSGLAIKVKENQLDALSTISGCGPAFFAYFIKHMCDAAAKKGLPRETAYKLAAKTLQGTGKL